MESVSPQERGGLRERARGGVQEHPAVPIESYKRLSAGETADHRLEKGRGADNRGRRQVLRREHHKFQERSKIPDRRGPEWGRSRFDEAAGHVQARNRASCEGRPEWGAIQHRIDRYV